MDNFLTWDYLLTFAGCVVGTCLITELTKKIFKQMSSKVYQIVSYVVALAILVIGQAATGALTDWGVVALDMINAAAVSLSSNGGYDAVKAIFVKKTDLETEFEDEGDEE